MEHTRHPRLAGDVLPAELVHDAIAVALQHRHQGLHACEHLALLCAREQRDDPAVVERIAPLTHLVDGTTERATQLPRIGVDRADDLAHETGEVAAHPRDAAELRTMGDFVDGDPEPEVARPERESLLEPQDVGADVIDGIDVARRAVLLRSAVLRDQQVVLTEDALRQPAEDHAHLRRRHRPADGTDRTLRDALGHPRRQGLQEAAHGRDVGIDPAGAVEHGGVRRAVDAQAGELTDECFGFGGRRGEVGVRVTTERYESASGSRPPKRRAMRAASAQSTGSGVVSVAGVAVAVTRPAGPAAWE